ncbi:hypothetical protein [Sinorhizobium sp. BJ1]|uniref:hypothetical protein n=1 Tax=Sinorhizobium sp. BJ1 TaxID=2035455 RepID=UPI000BE89365|nr:hypothetical protein [Sinorhizobium sp. BJ1]PDT81853.1 hypothetical protein CO676_20020 [Sinorhizobium sp. BJ1]
MDAYDMIDAKTSVTTEPALKPAESSHKNDGHGPGLIDAYTATSIYREDVAAMDALHTHGDAATAGDANPHCTVNAPEAETPAAALISQDQPAWTELSNKKFIRASQLAQLYDEDSKKAKTSKRPRLPLPLLHALRDAGISVDRALTMLPISRTHLRAACDRAKVKLTGDVAPSRTDSAPLAPPPSPKEPDMAAIQAALAIDPSEATERPCASAKNGEPRLSGEALGAKIRAIAHEIEVKEGVPPSYNRIHREYGFAIQTIKKYLPKKSAAASPTTEIEHPSTVDRAIVPASGHEMIQMVSEIVFGAELVPGTYIGNDGVVRCDDVTKLAGGLAPLVQKWRQHEAEVARILSTARELTVA